MKEIFPAYSGKIKKNHESLEHVLLDCEYIANCIRAQALPSKGKIMHRLFYVITLWLERTYGFRYGLSQGFVEKYQQLDPGLIRRSHNPNGSYFVLEHALPVNVLQQQMQQAGLQTGAEVLQYIIDTYHLHLITVEEDEILRKAGLAKKMPQGYYDPAHELYQDPLARYKTVGLVVYSEPVKGVTQI